eukprot:c13934_g1_i1.p1 GENE.c13934_g1_i1~~c13934_g1_i1.p1  ORF type:complete len:489 (+),score=107.60 c13934_g1_i1:110-1576(+)
MAAKDEQTASQSKTFTLWVNSHLRKRDGRKIDTLAKLGDGVSLVVLMEVLSNSVVNGGKYTKAPKIRVQMLENLRLALDHASMNGVKVTASPENFVDSNTTMILGFIWMLIIRFQIRQYSHQEPRSLSRQASTVHAEGSAPPSTKPTDGPAAESAGHSSHDAEASSGNVADEILHWARTALAAYTDLQFASLGELFASGDAFLALCELFGAQGINYATAKGMGTESACRLAYETAETAFDIPQLLDPEVAPDKLSLITYVSYYRAYEHTAKVLKREAAEREAAAAALKAKSDEIAAMEAKINALSVALEAAIPDDDKETQTDPMTCCAEREAAVRAELGVSLAKRDAELALRQKEVEAANADLATKEHVLSAARAAAAAKDHALSDSAAAAAESAAALTALRAELAAKDSEIARLTSENERLTAANAQLTGEVARLTAEVASLGEQLEEKVHGPSSASERARVAARAMATLIRVSKGQLYEEAEEDAQ